MKNITLTKIFFLLAGIIFFCGGKIFAQIPVSDTTGTTRLERVPDSTEMRMTDTLTPQPLEQILQQNKPQNEEPFRMKKSPAGAIWRSLVLPGWGQVYVENYWKAPVFLGAAGISAYNMIANHQKYSSKQDEIDARAGNLGEDERRLLIAQREVYRDNRDLSAFSLVVVYLVSAVDAYVGAHLYDFTVEDQASLNFLPSHDGGMKANLQFRW